MDLLTAYLITFGWALVGAVSMGVALFITLKVFTLLNRGVDEWKLIEEGSVPMAIVLGAVILAAGLVVAAAIRP